MILNKPMLRFLLYLSFLQLLSTQYPNYFATINAATSGTISDTGYYNYKYLILVPGRTYTITALGISGSGDTALAVYYPGGGYDINEDWGGTSYPKSSRLTMTATSAGIHTIYVYSRSGSFTQNLYITDVSPCSSSCTSCYNFSPQCTICPSGNICYSCSGGLFRLGADCLSTCPSGYSAVSGNCVFCRNFDYYCSSCNGAGCLVCNSGYGAYQGGCIYPCPSGRSVVNGVCFDCTTLHSSCTSCSNTNCLTCSGGLLPYGASCTNSCPVDIAYISGSICYPCSTLNSYCTKCTSSACLACSGGYVAQGTTCLPACSSGYYNNNGLCTLCTTLDGSCSTCISSTSCTSCSSGKVASGASCLADCPSDSFSSGGVCTACSTLHSLCTSCSSSSVCLGCSGVYVAQGSACQINCDSGYYNNNGLCTACSNVDSDCSTCTSSTSCTSCSNSKVASGSQCLGSCPSSTYNNNGLCTACSTLNGECLTCGSSSTCLSCDNSKVAYGATCVPSCPAKTFNNAGICTACSTLDNNCITCNSTVTCQACSGGLVALGKTCVSYCPSGTYNSGTQCISCATLDPDCQLCSNQNSCTSCANGKLIYGSMCLSSCPQGTSNSGGICTVISLKISLVNTDAVDVYLVQFPAALTNDIQVPLVSKMSLVGVDPSIYSLILTKQSNTVYQITIKYSQTIPSTTLRFLYLLDGSPPTTNLLTGQWTAEITSKYLAYMSEGTKAAVEAVNKVAGSSMQGAATGASSMAILGGNPALLWPLLNLFQAFYYLIFIDVNYPANCQMFLKIFSLGSLTFIPNPLEWFVKDIDQYSLPVPKRYNDYNFSGLFLDNAGNELLLVALTFGLYLISKACRKWIRRLPTLVRLSSNKTVEWFEWSGILRSLITSYTDIAQAVFLQLKVLAFYSTVFTLSSVLTFLTLGFIICFPVLIFIIIRRFNDQPELLFIKYETLAKEYDLKKKSSRNFVVIWLVRRLIMCLSLVFLQGYPYVQINILCILMASSILYTWVCAPYTTKKENVCNTLMEILFGCIHGVIYVLIYDDHNPYFSEDQRLQMGWVIIFACGAILIISMGLSLLEQVRVVIRGIRLLKQLLSKKDKKKVNNRKKINIEGVFVDRNLSTLNEKAGLFDNNLSTLDLSVDSPSTMKSYQASKPPRNMLQMKKIRREKLAHRIRELRQINS